MANANGGEAKKVEALQPHPVMEQLPGVQYCVNSPPPWPEALVLGFQHYFLTLGTTVLIPILTVPQMGGDNADKAKVIQTQLFVSGVNTLLHSFFGTRLPSVIGCSYAYLIPTISILQAKRYRKIQEPYEQFGETIRGIQGALIVASGFQMVIGFVGLWRNAVRFLSPLSIVSLVSFTGLGLYHLGFPLLAKCVEVGLPELALMVLISQASSSWSYSRSDPVLLRQFLKQIDHVGLLTQSHHDFYREYLPQYIKSKRPICDRFAVLFSVAIVWVYAEILTWTGAYNKSMDASSNCRNDRAGLISGAPWIYVPYPFQWGSPTFRAGEAFATMAAAFVASIESTGTFLATARYGSATPVPPSVVSRGVGWLGVGTLLGGIFGSVAGSTASVENAGLLALTRVGSRRVAQISAVFMIFFSIFGKFGAIFSSIPLPIIAALYCIFFGYVSSAGLSHLQFCNLNSFRTKFVLGLSFSLGLSLPQYFREHQLSSGTGPVHTHARWFNDIISVIFMSHATVAAVVALLLDCTLPHGDDEHHKDSGLHWWEKFVLYTKDVRSDEFYRLPCKLNKLFPSL
ncbi:unnamed protein product [Ilex paraguariensis]|uniref:Nucleobase-ascorbate transporter 10 n=1 Tax=Ilex paraguariensis TaxID=185542 RepID=A0ABC8RG15_9AQUA